MIRGRPDLRPDEVAKVVDRVRERFGPTNGTAGTSPAPAPAAKAGGAGELGIFPTIGQAVEAAGEAYRAFHVRGLEQRRGVVESIRRVMRENAERLAHLAHEETGLGRAEDKVLKNRLVIDKTPGPEDLEPTAWSGDRGLTITEHAPYGIVASITPTTNPTATIINNTIAGVSAGNALVFNVHPNAKRVSAKNVQLINRAVVEAGGPANLVTAIPEPTLETARELMNHPRVRILVVTGGPGVVEAALATKKRAITAGPGNPPVVVDATADLELAGREIVRGASFDNNVICTDEKEVFAVAAVADRLLRELEKNGAYVVGAGQLKRLEKVIFRELGEPGKPGKIDPRWIGQDAAKILAEIGIQAPSETRLAVVEVPAEHSLVWTEQMMPVLPIVRVRDVDEAIRLAIRAEHGFGHTASIFSRNVDTITRMAREIDVSIFVANAATLAGLGEGGEGFTSFSIASPTGEGLTRPMTFSRLRRLTVADGLRIV